MEITIKIPSIKDIKRRREGRRVFRAYKALEAHNNRVARIQQMTDQIEPKE